MFEKKISKIISRGAVKALAVLRLVLHNLNVFKEVSLGVNDF